MSLGEGILLGIGSIVAIIGVLMSYDGWQIGPKHLCTDDNTDTTTLWFLRVVGGLGVIGGGIAVYIALRQYL